MDKIFVVSTLRTGTKFLAGVLDEYEGVRAYHEPSPTFHTEGNRYLRWKHGTFRNTRIRGLLPLGTLYRWKFYLRRSVRMWGGQAETYVETNGRFVPFLSEIKRIFPEASFVHVVRHPGRWARSSLCTGAFLFRETGRPMHPFDTGEMTRDEWFDLSPFERANWYWLECNRLIRAQNPSLTVTFESIFSEPHEGFQRLLDFLGVDSGFSPEIFGSPTNSSYKVLPPFEEWESSWKADLAPAMDRYDERYRDS